MRRRLKSRIGLAAAALIALAAAACSSEPAPAPTATSVPTPEPTASAPTPEASAPVVATPPSSGKVTSDVENFILEELVVVVGTEVTWTNRDTSTHTVTSGSRGSSTGIWDSPELTKGKSYSFTFSEVGTFPYFCRIHPTSMNSTITVVPVEEPASVQASATSSPKPQRPTTTPVPPTATAVPPTATAVPPTATAVPPAATSGPPTATAVPPAATAVPPTATAQPTATAASPPTATPMPTATSAPTPEPIGSNIVDFALQNLTVEVGSTVIWTNVGAAPHTSTAGSPGSLSGHWDSTNLQTDGTFPFTFDQVGVFPYFCTIHPFMTATVTVVETDAEPVGDQKLAPSPTATAMTGGGGY